ncbi:hypothetical protein NDU88_005031 [Pleurodeles waltl]|uniref:Uncharacterized protein n=1 Tax=Pleurodeles waltl TaxID=8319 RepID=A0AAV7SKK8_PLEWA|nr:hypothetical protein NDU88_005031 [Pleurodeles waltl]
MPTNFLMDACCREKIAVALEDYMDHNWGVTDSWGVEWEALKAVLRGVCIGTVCGVRQQMEQELSSSEKELEEM